MKKNDLRIIKYLDGMMTPAEKEVFESELWQRKELFKEYEEIKSRFVLLKNQHEGEPVPGYFSELIPVVREKVQKEKGRAGMINGIWKGTQDFILSFKGAASVAVVAVLMLYVFAFRGGNNINETFDFPENEIGYSLYNDSEIEMINDEDLLNSVYSELIKGLGIGEEEVASVYSSSDLYGYDLGDVSEEELDLALRELGK